MINIPILKILILDLIVLNKLITYVRINFDNIQDFDINCHC